MFSNVYICTIHTINYANRYTCHGDAVGLVTAASGLYLPIRGADPVAVYHALAEGPGYILEFPDSAITLGFCSEIITLPDDPFDQLRSISTEPPFSPAGYLGYEGGGRFLIARDAAIITAEGITLTSRRPLEEAAEKIRRMADRVLSADLSSDVPAGSDLPSVLTTTMDRHTFTEGVRRLKSHIRDGDCYQAVLSRRIDVPFTGVPLKIYAGLRSGNPSCYGYYLDFGDEQIAGESPEMLISATGSTLTTVPIAGTRPRGSDPIQDDILSAELLADPKERSEHLMLVDLARNDIGRVAQFGSVHVSRYAEVARYPRVQHIVSTVTAESAPGSDGYDALRSCFPAGTVSGAPKKRAMELIAEEERELRGVYAGAIGFAGREKLAFAITIRTVVIRNSVASVQAGAGIVAGSDPDREYDETAIKAEACLRAIAAAVREIS
ncbi:MAG: anthranilate synthase component I family protein [Methanocalculus sp.]|uniref:anthranilate synthase component I family protein n=1 Tax=Methanocalculus sp. TaxID=2004547 RepID=UPI002728906C|nr:anthranilate synthase component I family protein [Methanocalculus sp.]MDO9538898.1 anthranilate synthase component I family protein [Methanocalculus sp.]